MKNKKVNDDEFLPKAFQKKSRKKRNQKNKNHLIKKNIILIIILLIIFALVRFLISYFNWKNIANQMIQNNPSQIIDINGHKLETIGEEKIKKNIALSNVPENLKNAYIAIEDQRFYKHHGIDIKRTGGAILSYIRHRGSSSFGGSTITQQLVKNLTGDSSNSITRKVKEWQKAFELETFLSKDKILESYLNIIYVGPNIYGISSGAKYYFNKNVKKLNLAECAFLAGINNAPNAYNPFGNEVNFEKINTRTKTVLNKMLELKYINEDEYNEAISEVDKGLNFKKGKLKAKSDGVYSYHTDSLISEVISDLSHRKNMSTTFASNFIEMSGLKIYSTQNSEIQNTMQHEFEKKIYILHSKKASDTSQAAMVIIEHSSGHVVGCVGGLGEKKTPRGLNRATQTVRQTGSAIKPLAVLAPCIQKRIITPITIYDDKLTTFDDGTEEGYTPIDYNKPLGKITVRRSVESSQNIPFVKMMEELTPKTSIKYLKKLGFTTLTDEDENLGLALGGLIKGFSPLEMAAAYGTLANGGKYIEPTFYTKIENSNSKTILKTKQKSHRVFSKSTCYVLTQLLNQPIHGEHGTATYCALNGIEVAAKTGTTNDNFDKWLCEYTPYYTSSTWYGFDLNESINYYGKNPAGIISARVMSKVHSNLADKSFEKPLAVSSSLVCPETGLVANNGCPGSYIEYFLFGTVPDKCTKHSSSSNNKKTNKSNSTTNNKNTKSEKKHIIINLEDENVFTDDVEESNTDNLNSTTNTTYKNETNDNQSIDNKANVINEDILSENIISNNIGNIDNTQNNISFNDSN